MIELITTPLGRGRFCVEQNGRVICPSSRQPLLDGARALLAEGYPPDTIVAMRHKGSSHIAMRAVIGKAGKLTVDERTGVTVFREWEPYPSSRGSSPMRYSGPPVVDIGSE